MGSKQWTAALGSFLLKTRTHIAEVYANDRYTYRFVASVRNWSHPIIQVFDSDGSEILNINTPVRSGWFRNWTLCSDCGRVRIAANGMLYCALDIPANLAVSLEVFYETHFGST